LRNNESIKKLYKIWLDKIIKENGINENDNIEQSWQKLTKNIIEAFKQALET